MLMNYYKYLIKKTELDALDPTAEANSTKKLSNWGFGSNSEYVLTSNESSKWQSWCLPNH